MKLAELVILKEGYDTSEKNREHHDDLAEWKRAVRHAGADFTIPNFGATLYRANAHDGFCGEFDTEKGEGWLVNKWSKSKMNEGMFVVKSKDGVEKRFKDTDSAEAKAWKEQTAKKTNVKLAVYSDAYWEKKEDDSDDRDFMTPWTKIGERGDDSDQIERLVKDQHGAGQTDWTLGKVGEMKREGTSCATRVVRIMFEYGPDDDMGVDEPTSDTQSILVARNPKKPKQLDFVNYV